MGYSREKESFFGKDTEITPHSISSCTSLSQSLIYITLAAVVMHFPLSAIAQNQLTCRPTDNVTASQTEARPSQVSIETILLDPRIKRCKKTVPDIKRLLQLKNATVVDVQDTQNFKKTNIPNSINFPRHIVKTKSFLKTRHLLVVGEGFNDEQLFGTCLELIDHGFQHVSILEGGVQRWLRLLGSTKSVDAKTALPVIQPRDVYTALEENDWKVVVLDINKEIELLNLFPNREVMGVGQFQNEYRLSGGVGKYLFVSKDGAGYSYAKKLLKSNDGANSFWLDGGGQEFNRFLQNREIMLAKLQRGDVRRSGCGL